MNMIFIQKRANTPRQWSHSIQNVKDRFSVSNPFGFPNVLYAIKIIFIQDLLFVVHFKSTNVHTSVIKPYTPLSGLKKKNKQLRSIESADN